VRGGVQVALAQKAEAIYAWFTPKQQTILRRVMLRLTQPHEGTAEVRRLLNSRVSAQVRYGERERPAQWQRRGRRKRAAPFLVIGCESERQIAHAPFTVPRSASTTCPVVVSI
jgi:hypothetical protein